MGAGRTWVAPSQGEYILHSSPPSSALNHKARLEVQPAWMDIQEYIVLTFVFAENKCKEREAISASSGHGVRYDGLRQTILMSLFPHLHTTLSSGLCCLSDLHLIPVHLDT